MSNTNYGSNMGTSNADYSSNIGTSKTINVSKNDDDDDNIPDFLKKYFTKDFTIMISWFLAIYILLFICLNVFFSSSGDNLVSTDYGASRVIDLTIFIFLIIYGIASYLIVDKHTDIFNYYLNSTASWFKDQTSIVSVVFSLIFFYMITFLLKIPLTSNFKPFFLGFIESMLWVVLTLIMIVDFFMYILQIPIVDTTTDFIRSGWKDFKFHVWSIGDGDDDDNSSVDEESKKHYNDINHPYHGEFIDDKQDFKINNLPQVGSGSSVPIASSGSSITNDIQPYIINIYNYNNKNKKKCNKKNINGSGSSVSTNAPVVAISSTIPLSSSGSGSAYVPISINSLSNSGSKLGSGSTYTPVSSSSSSIPLSGFSSGSTYTIPSIVISGTGLGSSVSFSGTAYTPIVNSSSSSIPLTIPSSSSVSTTYVSPTVSSGSSALLSVPLSNVGSSYIGTSNIITGTSSSYQPPVFNSGSGNITSFNVGSSIPNAISSSSSSIIVGTGSK